LVRELTKGAEGMYVFFIFLFESPISMRHVGEPYDSNQCTT
jgi:hypothetical protein